MDMILDKKHTWAIFLFEFKMGHKTVESSHNINNTFGSGTTQWWFKKYCKGDQNLEDEQCTGRPSNVDSDQLEQSLKLILLKLHEKLAKNLSQTELSQTVNIDRSMVILHLKQIGRVEKLNKRMPHELNKNFKNRHLEVSSSLILCHNDEPLLDQIVTCN